MISPLTQALARRAYLQALLGGTSAAQAAGMVQPQAQQPQQGAVNVRRAQQQGGHESVPGGGEGRGGGIGSLLGNVAGTVLGGPLWGMAGGMVGGLFDSNRRSGGTSARTSLSLGQQYPELGEQFRTVMGRQLSGGTGLPRDYYQQALLRGMAGINQQAQYSREGLMARLGQRGLLNSGAIVRGLSEVERGRLGSLADYHGSMQRADIDARRQALLNAMQTMAGSRQQAAGAQAAREQVRMQQPTTWDYVAQLAGAAAPYIMGRPASPSYEDYLAALTGAGTSRAPDVRDTPRRSPFPPGFGEYIEGWA